MKLSEVEQARAAIKGIISHIDPDDKFIIPYGQAFNDCLCLGFADYLKQPYEKVIQLNPLGEDASFRWDIADTSKLYLRIRKALENATDSCREGGNNLVRLMTSYAESNLTQINFKWFFGKGDLGRLSGQQRQHLSKRAKEEYSQEELEQLKGIAACMIPHIRERAHTEEVCVV